MSVNTSPADATQSDKQQKLATLKKLADELGFELKPTQKAFIQTPVLQNQSPREKWHMLGKRSPAADFLCKCLFEGGIDQPGEIVYYPADPISFAHCQAMLDITGARDRFMSVANNISPVWGLLAKHWNELSNMMSKEAHLINLRASLEALVAIGHDKGSDSLFNTAATDLDDSFIGKPATMEAMRIRALVRYGVDVNAFGLTGTVPLLAAVKSYEYAINRGIKNPSREILCALIDVGAKPDIPCRNIGYDTTMDYIKHSPHAVELQSIFNIEIKKKRSVTP